MTRTFPACSPSSTCTRSTTTRPGCWPRCAPRRPTGIADPCVVVLTPGVVQRRLLRARPAGPADGRGTGRGRATWSAAATGCAMRTTQGERPVHVVYRRVDDDFLDPLHFRPDSVIGCPGIINAARAGHVTLANAVGNGVADDKLLYTYVPDLIRYYLSEEPLLSTTWSPTGSTTRTCCTACSDQLDELVLKPVDGAGGKGIVIGPQATEATLDALRARVAAPTRGAGSPSGRWPCPPRRRSSARPWRPRHIDLRPFAVNDGNDVWLLPGGLTRVALPGGRAGRQLQPGRRLQGHLGAGQPGEPESPAPGRPCVSAADRPRPALVTCPRCRASSPSTGRADRPGRPAMNERACSAGSPRRCSGPAVTSSGRTTPPASSTRTCTGCSRTRWRRRGRRLPVPARDPRRRRRPHDARLDIGDVAGPARPSTSRTRARSPARCVAARRNARGVREAISSEMWECLNVDLARAGRRGAVAAERLGPARLPRVHPGTGRAVLRPGRLDHEPRRRLAVPGARAAAWSGWT